MGGNRRVMVKIVEKEGFMLNPDQRKVTTITSLIEKNGGVCICHNESRDPHCACSDFLEKGICHCGLYVVCNKDIK